MLSYVYLHLSSCGWNFPWKNDKHEESSTEKKTEKSFKDDEPSSPPPIEDDDSKLPLPKDTNVLSFDNNEDESSRESSAQPTKTTLENVSAMPNEEFDEESSKFANSEKKIKSMPTTSTNSTDKIVNYVSLTTTQITDSSTPTTEKSESESSTTDNTNTPTTTENTLNVTDDGNNVPRNADEDREDSKGTSSVVSSSTISSSLENSSFENEVVSNSSEYILPEVTYAPNDKDISISIDEEKEPTSDDQQIGRKDKEIHSPRNVTDEADYSTQIITTENYESGDSTTDMTNTPKFTENMLNSTSNNEARNVINGTESYDNDKKRGTLVGSGSTGSFFVNFTLNVCVFLGDLLFFNSSFT
ncbi:dentin sialophosphoprotein-like [Tetranychus urticae]|uniref:dentin sialophosphoprotein-like n=1 Tax=Tetranychus urticae TaxID=32264 RepID=UPI000D65DA3F|nr:dentin sialophosphoprotein-like [Tetranychus urticae]